MASRFRPLSGSSCPCLSPGRGHYVVFLDNTLNHHYASLHPGVQMGTELLNLVIDTWFENIFMLFLFAQGHLHYAKQRPTDCCQISSQSCKQGRIYSVTHNAKMMNEIVAWLLSACVKRLKDLYMVSSGFRTRLLAITCHRGIRQEAQTQSFTMMHCAVRASLSCKQSSDRRAKSILVSNGS